MFTGLIEAMGKVRRVEPAAAGRKLTISASTFAEELEIGESVAINGACLTLVERERDACRFEIGPETLRRTNLGELAEGDRVNLERALRLSDRLGGHLVQGHVDGVGHISERRREGQWETVWFGCSPELATQMVPKGSVAVDGISLTLVEVATDHFSVMLIPHTLANTTLGFKKRGATVNVETDILAKYVLNFIHGRGVTLDTLVQAGFVAKPASVGTK
jgi:riboflavin synthase